METLIKTIIDGNYESYKGDNIMILDALYKLNLTHIEFWKDRLSIYELRRLTHYNDCKYDELAGN